jgi:hypothetical protein
MRYSRSIPPKFHEHDSGVALILVMLAMLVLSVLAATIVFTARSETFASTNFRLDTQADYLAKAGVQRAINWFRSSHNQAVSQNANPPVGQLQPATSYYNVNSSGTPFFLLMANSSPVNCIGAAPICPSQNNQVQLIGYGGGASNYPNINNAVGTAVATAFANDLNTVGNTRITGDTVSVPNRDSGYFNVNAILLSYQTVNVNPPLPAIPPPYNVTPVETWLITAQATWTDDPNSTGMLATAEEVAIVQPIYVSTWGNALYGFCSVTMGGSAGTCTDAFNSALGAYAMGNTSVAAGKCDNTTVANVLDTGAGVGSNGGVTLGSNVTVAGNVTIGTGAPAGCPVGYSGSTSSVLGQVINGPYIAPPPIPTFRAGFPGAAPSFPTGEVPPTTVWPWKGGPPPWSPPPAWPNSDGYNPAVPGAPCMDATCNGTQSHPYEVTSIGSTGGMVQLIGGPDVAHPIYYDVGTISESGKGAIYVSGYVVLNVQSSLTIHGQGVTNGITTSVPPEAVVINYAGTSGVAIGGNGSISAVINAPNATVTFGGGGSAGYMVGAVQAKDISVMGGYPIHYDVQLARTGGNLGVMLTTAYGRKKM